MYPDSDLLTKDENLFERVTTARLIQIVKRRDVVVYECERSTNMFGEFLFVTFTHCKDVYQFHGCGYHDYREDYVDYFFTDRGQDFYIQGRKAMDKAEVVKKIEAAYSQVKGRHDTPSERGQIFSMVADMTDEDGAWSFLQDLEV